MPSEKYIRLIYQYLKQGKWKQKTEYVKPEDLKKYEDFKIISQKEVWR
jgi:hypothetical protein